MNIRRINKSSVLTAVANDRMYDSRSNVAKTGNVSISTEMQIVRTPFNKLIAAEEIDFETARYEMSQFAVISNTAGTDFAAYEGKQVRYLLTIDGLFFTPTHAGAIAELMEAGIIVTTRLATYEIAKPTIPTPNQAIKAVAEAIRRTETAITPEVEWYFVHGKYTNRIRFSIVSKRHYIIGDDTWNRNNPTKQEFITNEFHNWKMRKLAA